MDLKLNNDRELEIHQLPTKSRFYLDYDSPVSSESNKAAWDIFWEDFLRIGYACQDEKDDVKRAFHAHVKYLKSRRRALPLTTTEESARRRSQRLHEVSFSLVVLGLDRLMIANQLYLRRKKTFESFFNPSDEFWAFFSPQLLSSDDSDRGGGEITLTSRRMFWRDPELDMLFDEADEAHLAVRSRTASRTPGGAPLTKRRRGNQLSRRNAPTQFPTPFYRDSWLEGLSQRDRATLQTSSAIVRFPAVK